MSSLDNSDARIHNEHTSAQVDHDTITDPTNETFTLGTISCMLKSGRDFPFFQKTAQFSVNGPDEREKQRTHVLSHSSARGQSTACLLIEIDHFVDMWVDA